MTKKIFALAALSCLTACERISETVNMADFSKERADRQYREAMAAYSVGQLGTAISKLKKVCAADPANASARFQLACILQENEKDYLGAYCAYNEYLLQHPNSDKAKLADSRMQGCERSLATVLADKYGLNVSEAQRKETEAVSAKLKKTEALRNKLAKDVETLMRRVNALNEENARLKTLMLERNSAEETEAPKDEIAEAKELIIEDDSAEVTVAEIAEAKTIVIEEAETTPEEVIEEGKGLLEELASEQAVSPLLVQPADAKEKRKEAEAKMAAMQAEKAAKSAEADARRAKRPDRYVVQSGDSLYKIAERFYGRKSAWQAIREANKTTITPDGRLKKGQTIILPDLPE